MTHNTRMNQVSFQCRLLFLAAIQTSGFHTTKLLGYLNNRGFLTKALYNKNFSPVNFGTCIGASKTRLSKLYRFSLKYREVKSNASRQVKFTKGSQCLS